ncbi:MAG: ABC transporter ATP-binding protein, partial [Candidatus Lokiarchaeota archaeon]|nr:ABC transporter ATP-binding protein [Candidatus Lokiarchaeota archaeon]
MKSAIKEDSNLLLQVKNLKTYFYTEEGIVKAVDGVSFNIFKNEVLGLVGETGCGKSVTALSILRLVRSPGKIIEGSIEFNNVNMLELSEEEMRSHRGNDITMIFQDPLNSLNPVILAGDQVAEVFLLHQEEELNKIMDVRLLERDKLVQELKELKKEFKENKEQLSETEKEEFKVKIKDFKKKIPKAVNLKDVALEKAEQII